MLRRFGFDIGDGEVEADDWTVVWVRLADRRPRARPESRPVGHAQPGADALDALVGLWHGHTHADRDLGEGDRLHGEVVDAAVELVEVVGRAWVGHVRSLLSGGVISVTPRRGERFPRGSSKDEVRRAPGEPDSRFTIHDSRGNARSRENSRTVTDWTRKSGEFLIREVLAAADLWSAVGAKRPAVNPSGPGA
ncbi:MAG: DUF2845 domain-containing protein [Dehalococcoidia bacterium]|nr:DUF2845 domain-containing protein [Dehalococcoidia bacterium]